MAAAKTLRPTVPNAGLAAWYRRSLLRMVGEMHRSVTWWVGRSYKERLPEITQDAARAQKQVQSQAAIAAREAEQGRLCLPQRVGMDSSPSRDLERELKQLFTQWGKQFDDMAKSLSRRMVHKAERITTRSMLAALRDGGMTVRFRGTPAVNKALQRLISEQSSLISSIPGKYMDDVRGLVMRSVREGRDMGFLTEKLEERYGMTRRRAITIARDQTNKATESISLVRNQDLGITEGIWMHRSGSKTPRKSHKDANGKRFLLSEGLKIDGAYVLPGEMINCHCTYKPVLPALQGEERL